MITIKLALLVVGVFLGFKIDKDFAGEKA